MFDFCLHGHLVLDTILELNGKQTSSLGGIANLWKPLVSFHKTVCVSPSYYGEALILINRELQIKYVKAHLNSIQLPTEACTAKWHHIAYINELENLEFLHNLTGFISADTCSGKSIDKRYLKYLDYLFCSSDELNQSPEELVKEMTTGTLIVHDNTGCQLYNRNGIRTFPVNRIKTPLNILGAGDVFAANVIAHLQLGFSIEYSIKTAQHETIKTLLTK